MQKNNPIQIGVQFRWFCSTFLYLESHVVPWTITPTGIASGEYRFSTTGANGSAPFALDTTKPVQDQLGQLASYVRELRALIAPIDQQIVRLERAIADGRQHAETVAAQALADAKSHADKRLRDAGGKTPLARWRSLGKRPAETVMKLCCSCDIRLIKWPPRWQLSGGRS